MSKEQIILLIINGITLAGLILLTPRSRLREAAVVYTFKQSITWVLGLLIVEYHLIEYPAREFIIANRTSFSFEFFIYPAICVIYNLHFPADRGWGRKWAWILVFPTVMTLFEVALEKYTDLIEYVSWTWYWTWLSLLATFFVSRGYYLWFRKGVSGPAVEHRGGKD
ncbi:hypothetical protein PM3016_5701 [Paenibacillus mucilaginosus 3016]|uniref:Uncharacterized protein n=1 Tax=Paenibacillus mucilaginosus 3016 TaxID=1116391 RepID=H6NKJ2_9BACL|nr:CBO0543 family protein [Paenibacillus mucilaginosus]AFC32383.1 hypothetical protein PM3016_5701 [Paenibacillus mucilaginosus 3016]WFA20875.1 hypothetical protein ERY13_28335 [Paenibacillus mucilaginosus]